MGAERKITIMLPEELLERALKASGEGITPTFELLSGPGLNAEARRLLLELPRLDLLEGFWERAGDLRRGLLKIRSKINLRACKKIKRYCDLRIDLSLATTILAAFAITRLPVPAL